MGKASPIPSLCTAHSLEGRAKAAGKAGLCVLITAACGPALAQFLRSVTFTECLLGAQSHLKSQGRKESKRSSWPFSFYISEV